MPGKQRLFFLLKIFIAVIILIWVIVKIQAQTIAHSLPDPARPLFIFLACILLVPNLIIQTVRWRFLLKLIQNPVSIRETVASLFGGWTIGLFTPARLGEFSRAWFLEHSNRMKTVGMVFIDKFYSSIINIIFGIWGLFAFFSGKPGTPVFIWVLMGISGSTLTILGMHLMLKPGSIRTFFYNMSLLLPFREKIKMFIEGLDCFRNQNAGSFIALSAAVYVIYIAQFCFLALAFESIPVKAVIISTVSTMFAKMMLPFSIGDLGIREIAAIYFFKHYSIRSTTAFNSAFLLFIINIIFPALLGLIFIPKIKWRENGQVRQS